MKNTPQTQPRRYDSKFQVDSARAITLSVGAKPLDECFTPSLAYDLKKTIAQTDANESFRGLYDLSENLHHHGIRLSEIKSKILLGKIAEDRALVIVYGYCQQAYHQSDDPESHPSFSSNDRAKLFFFYQISEYQGYENNRTYIQTRPFTIMLENAAFAEKILQIGAKRGLAETSLLATHIMEKIPTRSRLEQPWSTLGEIDSSDDHSPESVDDHSTGSAPLVPTLRLSAPAPTPHAKFEKNTHLAVYPSPQSNQTWYRLEFNCELLPPLRIGQPPIINQSYSSRCGLFTPSRLVNSTPSTPLETNAARNDAPPPQPTEKCQGLCIVM